MPKLSKTEFEARAIPRLKRMDALWKKIQAKGIISELDDDYILYRRLMDEQSDDEVAAGM
jgi:hypothetical protein